MLAGLGNLLLGIAYPFLLYIVAVTAVLYFLYLLFKLRTLPWLAGFQTALIFLIPAPLYLYFLYVWQTNDIFRIWDTQAGTPSPPWPHYLVGFGVMLLLAGLVVWKRPSSRPHFAIDVEASPQNRRITHAARDLPRQSAGCGHAG